jgi:hypothetical protein
MKRTMGITTGLVLGLALVGMIPTVSREGVDEALVVHRIPLWEKAAKFYIRHVEFSRWAHDAAGGETDPQRRVLRLMNWTMKQVQHIPPGLPLIDDHISHIVLRHYGSDGQRAEVFTALTTYTGNEGRWWGFTPPGAKRRVTLSFVRSNEGWWVVDVSNGAWFETPDGKIATIADFQRPERLRRRGPEPNGLDGTPYLAYYRDLDRVFQKSFSRAPGQIPWHRLLMVLGVESDDNHLP